MLTAVRQTIGKKVLKIAIIIKLKRRKFMFTGLVVAVTVVLLWFTGYRLYKAKNIIKKEKVGWLALSAFMGGFGILCYGVRSLFIDAPNIDTFVYRLGITVHIGLGFIPFSIFVFSNFFRSKIARYFFIGLTIIGSGIMTVACWSPQKRIVKPAPFEPIPMRMSNYPWINPVWKNVFIWFSIGLSLILIWTAFSYALRNKKEAKGSGNLVMGILMFILSIIVLIMPFAALQPWYAQWQYYFVYFYIAFAILVIWLSASFIDRKKQINVSLYYGLGAAFLLFPAMLCVFITPIFARLLYVPGAIFLYLAFRNELKSLETQNYNPIA